MDRSQVYIIFGVVLLLIVIFGVVWNAIASKKDKEIAAEEELEETLDGIGIQKVSRK